MRKLVILLALTALVAMLAPTASVADNERATALVRTKLSRSLTHAELVGENIDILAAYRDGRVDLAVTEIQLDWLRIRDPMVVVLERAGLAAPMDLDENLGLYHTYAELQDALDSLATEYPSLTRLDTLGTSWEGRQIRAIKISDFPGVDEDEPEVLIMGCHHARELMSVEVPLLFAQYLLTNYGTSPEVTRLVDTREIWFAPMINPDGHVYVQNNHSDSWWNWWRKNRRDNGGGIYGVDLNRNYSYQWGYDDVGSSPDPSSLLYRGPSAFSEPETQAVRDFCAGRDFSLALSYHSYSELILFPWGYAPIYTIDHDLFLALGDSLSRGNGYYIGNTAMGAIYATNGETDDWAYGETSQKNRFCSYTIELNSYEEGGFGPPDNLILPTFEKMLELNMTLLRRADNPRGVLGPRMPIMEAVQPLSPPNYSLHWRSAMQNDPNPVVAWELVEYKNLIAVADSCEAGDDLWTTDGFSLQTARAYAGASSYYSGAFNDAYHTLEMASFYPLYFGDTLRCHVWYDIETDWDYAYLEASTDQGVIWKTIPGSVTTNYNPNGTNRGNGITGISGGWIAAEFYLDNLGVIFEDATVLVRFAYVTDDYTLREGFYVDMITPVPDYEAKTVLAAAHPDTFFVRWPSETGLFTYAARGVDAEGHWSGTSNIVTQVVDDLTPAAVPALRTTLSQNYPNPFNPVTTIRFSVGEEDIDRSGTAPVTIMLYDVAGRRVAELKRERLGAGSYTVSWDGRGTGGRLLASGVYFARLRVGNIVLTKKMVLLR